jgi:uncharacterized protein DUF6328
MTTHQQQDTADGQPETPGRPETRGRFETHKERLDRELIELLQGFRVAVTGVQVMFAFLLTVPFATGFDRLSGGGRDLYYVALFSAALASVCFIAPVAQHRILFRTGKKELLIKRANRYGIVGALALAVGIAAATALIMELLVSSTAATIAAAVFGGLAAWMWFLQPLLARRSWGPESAED